jgi:two-component system cell cycle response regulator CtrA
MTSPAATAYQDEIKKLRERNDYLEEELRQLKRGVERSPAIVEFRIPGAYLTRCESRVLNALIQADLVTKDAVHASVYPQQFIDDAPEIKIIDVFVCKLRQKLKSLAIEINTVWGRGFSMSPEDRRRCNAWLVRAVSHLEAS